MRAQTKAQCDRLGTKLKVIRSPRFHEGKATMLFHMVDHEESDTLDIGGEGVSIRCSTS